MTTYTWKSESLTVEIGPDTEGHSDVVYLAGWRFIATDAEGHNAQAFGTVSVAPWEAPEPFIPFEDLTEAIVQVWVEEALGPVEIAEMTARLDANIEEQATPTHETYYTMPWDENGD